MVAPLRRRTQPLGDAEGDREDPSFSHYPVLRRAASSLSVTDLARLLRGLDGQSYPAYRRLSGEQYQVGELRVLFDHVQGDPFASPSRLRIDLPPEWARLLDPARPATCFIYQDEVSGQVNDFEADAVAALQELGIHHT